MEVRNLSDKDKKNNDFNDINSIDDFLDTSINDSFNSKSNGNSEVGFSTEAENRKAQSKY